MIRAKQFSNTPLIVISAILFCLVTVFTARYLLFRKIQTNVNERLENLRKQGVKIRFESAELDLFTGTLEIHQLKIQLQNKKDPSLTTEAIIPYAAVKEVKIFPFILNRHLLINSISLQQATINYNIGSPLLQDEARKAILENIEIDHINISRILVCVRDFTGNDTLANVYSDIEIKQLGLRRSNDSLIWKNADVIFSNTTAEWVKGHYTCAAKYLRINMTGKSLELDSMTIIPSYDRHTFMKLHGRQVDYVTASIPTIRAKGLDVTVYPEVNMKAKKIALSFNADVFRDKRYRFLKKSYTTLPLHFLQQLPIHIKVDSILIHNSYVAYEELSETSKTPGKIFFDNLTASICNLQNNNSATKDVTLNANAKFMGTGNLDVHFTFPPNLSKPCLVKGSLKNLSLPTLNSMLSLTKIRVESGIMNNLKFNFMYNLFRADGEVEMNYQDLKITSLRDNKKNEEVISLIKTLLLSTLVIKRNLDEDVKDYQKKGNILFYRDSQRSVFNYWWKSVLSGIKEAYKIDQLQEQEQRKSNRKLSRKKKKELIKT